MLKFYCSSGTVADVSGHVLLCFACFSSGGWEEIQRESVVCLLN